MIYQCLNIFQKFESSQGGEAANSKSQMSKSQACPRMLVGDKFQISSSNFLLVNLSGVSVIADSVL